MSNSAGPKITKDGLVLDFDAANPKSYNFYADPYASNVSLYLQMNGANGSTAFTDDSINRYTITSYGTATISTSQSKYNGSSAYFDGSGARLGLATTGIDFGAGDFTAECWIYLNANPPSANSQIMGKHVYGTGASWILQLNASRVFSFLWNDGVNVLSSGVALNLSQWYHVAVCRSGSTIKIFINGAEAASTTISYTFTSSTEFTIASSSNDNANARINAYIDNVRLTNAARYTASFTSPPIPSTCTDLTRSKNVGTLTGGVDYNFSNGGSLVFDGSNDYVNIPASTNLTFGTGDFTMEVWFKTRAKTMLYPALLSVNLAWAANVWVLIDRHNVTAPTKFTFHVYNIASPTLTSVTAPSNGVWYNVVVTRIGTLFSMYVNGVLESTATSSGSLDGGVSNSINLGRQSASDSTNYDGNISHARIYKAKGLTSAEVYNNFVANRGRFGV